ncbi:MAG: hypothetical protein WC001_07005 [Desulfurivibrionaceae bacterium]
MGDGMMGAGVVMGLLILVFAVVSILVPFFVLRIRNEAIKTNQKLDTIIGLLKK